jgi:hypothetical protein
MRKFLLILSFFYITLIVKAQTYFFTSSSGEIKDFTFTGLFEDYGDGTYLQTYHIEPTDKAGLPIGKVSLRCSDQGWYYKDKIYIYDGPGDYYSPLLAYYDLDLHRPTDSIVSTSCYVTIYIFTDNRQLGGQGWAFEYKSYKPEPQIYNELNGTFSDGVVPLPQTESWTFLNYDLHTYLIKPSGGTNFQMSFPEINLSNSELWIYNGENDNAPLIGSYGLNYSDGMVHLPPSLIQSSSNKLFLKYLADGVDPLIDHWTAQYTSTTGRLSFDYDASGNRIHRNFITLKSASAQANVSSSYTRTPYNLTKPYEEKQGDQDIKIYPNPTSGQLKVEITGVDVTQKSAIYVYDLQGKLIILKSPVTGSDVIDLSNYVNGLYLMKILLGDKSSEWKIVKE